MAILQGTLPGTSLTPPAKEEAAAEANVPNLPAGPDDDSSQAHRQLIGSVGLLLPLLLWLITGLRPNEPSNRWEWLGSISAYYYTSAVAAFIGLLIALSLYLFAYRGYKNRWQWADKWCARIAAVAALGVAFFPKDAPTAAMQPPWWANWMKLVHYGSTVFLFSAFAVFSIWIFTLPDPEGAQTSDKTRRDWVYRTCGVAIVLGMIAAFVMGYFKKPILVPEIVVLVAFATSWLVKGEIRKTIGEAIKKKN